jgi:phasin family protein
MAMNDGKLFADFDFGKLFSGLNFPLFNVEMLMTTQRKNIEAITHAHQLAFEGLQAAAKRHTEMARSALEEAHAAILALAQPGSPERQIMNHAELAKTSFEKAMAHGRELSELVAKANSEAFNIIANRVSESLHEVATHHAVASDTSVADTAPPEPTDSETPGSKRRKAG